MTAIRKFIAAMLAFFQMILINLGIVKPEMKSVPVEPVSNSISGFTVPDKTETDLYKTVEYAAGIKNVVQCGYSCAERKDYIMKNNDIVFTHNLKDTVKASSVTDKNGNAYISGGFRTFYEDKSGIRHYFENSFTDGRVNTIRLGEYYYECHVRDLKNGTFKVDKTFHVYADRLYTEYSLLSDKASRLPEQFGSEIKIPVEAVGAIEIKDKNGIHTSVDGVDASTVEFAAFDIINTGIIGFIVPSDGSTLSLTVEKGKKEYTVTQIADFGGETGINKYDETGDYNKYKFDFGCRLYTDLTHSFSGIETEAYTERTPLTLTVSGSNVEAVSLGYEALRGTYGISMNGFGFVYCYENPDFRPFVKLNIKGDALDRKITVRTTTPDSGCLESAVLLDKNDLLMPVDIEVCKNFMGDGGDEKYSYKDYMYGDTFTPMYIEKDSEKDFTVVNLYQNWGNYPLKQLSSIEFHTSYYHLSTGTTESNCIAPYFVMGRDGWTLPDFRNASGKMWDTQPQFNSVGILKFVSYRDKKVKQPVYSEYIGSKINSYGPTYSDIEEKYVSDDGKYSYTLNHIEFPQNDENRTYYSVDIEFNDSVTFENFRRDFDLFYFDGRYVAFNNIGYLDENNSCINAPVSQDITYHRLGTEAPYFGLYGITEKTLPSLDNCMGCNFALLVKDYAVSVGGEARNIPLAFREYGDEERTEGCLTFDTENITFNKGDSIKLDIILLPWGTGKETNDRNVITVREDSLLKPLTVKGSDKKPYIPTVKAVDNKAEFTVSGGRNNNAVKIDGFTSMKQPHVYIFDGEWKEYNISSVHGYDGYMIRTNPDNTFSLSFVYKAENPEKEYTFRIVVE